MALPCATSSSTMRTPPPSEAAPNGGWLLVMPLRAGTEHVLGVVGEADMSTADQLREALLAAVATRPPALRVELDGLDFCDLAGLDALHDATRAAAAAGVPFSLTGMSTQLAWLHRQCRP